MNNRIVLISILLVMVGSLAGVSASADSVIDTLGGTPFLYEALSYVPLNGTAGFLGALLGWDATKRQAVVNYDGEELVLTPNSLNAMFAGKPVVLPAPPVIINGVTYVPASTLKKLYHVPMAWDSTRSEVRIKGPNGWGTMKASSRAPWHGGPPPWAPAWGQRGYKAPGHSVNTKSIGSGRTKAWVKHGYSAPGHPKNEKGECKRKGKRQ